MITTISSMTRVMRYYQPWIKISWITFKENPMKRAFGSLDVQNLRKINLMFFKLRNVATLSTSDQHNLNIGISGYILYRRTQKTGTLGKGARKHNRRKTDQDLKTTWRHQPAPYPQRNMMRAVEQGARVDWWWGLPSYIRYDEYDESVPIIRIHNAFSMFIFLENKHFWTALIFSLCFMHLRASSPLSLTWETC